MEGGPWVLRPLLVWGPAPSSLAELQDMAPRASGSSSVKGGNGTRSWEQSSGQKLSAPAVLVGLAPALAAQEALRWVQRAVEGSRSRAGSSLSEAEAGQQLGSPDDNPGSSPL